MEKVQGSSSSTKYVQKLSLSGHAELERVPRFKIAGLYSIFAEYSKVWFCCLAEL